MKKQYISPTLETVVFVERQSIMAESVTEGLEVKESSATLPAGNALSDQKEWSGDAAPWEEAETLDF